jgi:hypothetical protein
LNRGPLLSAVREEEEKGFNPDSPRPGVIHATYRRSSHYSYFCPVMEQMFGRENILYLNSDELSENPQRAQEVLPFSRCKNLDFEVMDYFQLAADVEHGERNVFRRFHRLDSASRWQLACGVARACRRSDVWWRVWWRFVHKPIPARCTIGNDFYGLRGRFSTEVSPLSLSVTRNARNLAVENGFSGSSH